MPIVCCASIVFSSPSKAFIFIVAYLLLVPIFMAAIDKLTEDLSVFWHSFLHVSFATNFRILS